MNDGVVGGAGLVGQPVLRIEDARLVTGRGRYVDDIVLPDALRAHFVRATSAHARLTAIDTSGAAGADGVVCVLTAEDLDGETMPTRVEDPSFAQPLLAGDVVRYVGEPVAVVVATDAYKAADAAEGVVVDYEDLPAVIDLHAALSDEVVLFGDAGTNVCAAGDSADPVDFDSCEVVVELEMTNQKMAAAPIEPRVAAAWWDDDRLLCLSSVQGANQARYMIAKALRLDPDRVRVTIPDVGGAFGAKSLPGPEEALLGLLARRTRRPVRWSETRSESFIALGHARAQRQVVKLGGTRAGHITHVRFEVLGDVGAYPKFAPVIHSNTAVMAAGPYRVTHVETRVRSVVTNTAPVHALRGAGRPEAAAGLERALDVFAAEISLDPVELRRRNLIGRDEFPYTVPTGLTYDSGDYHRALDEVVAAADYDDLRARQAERLAGGARSVLGIGVATYVEITARGDNQSEVGVVELSSDGRLVARTGSTPTGQGHETTWSMILADRTGLPVEAITVLHGDTAEAPNRNLTVGSRSVQLAGSAICDAGDRLVAAAREVAADALEAPFDDVVLDTDLGFFHVRGTPTRSLTWADVAATTDTGLRGEGDVVQASSTFPFGAHFAVVEVDLDTGAVELLRLIACDDAGRLINPLLAEGQVHGGLATGVAQALYEEIRYDPHGNLRTSNFTDYAIVSAAEMGDFERIVSETPTGLNPLGAKGIGESGAVGATPAIHNAVVDALSHLGVGHLEMPATPRRVHETIRAASGGG